MANTDLVGAGKIVERLCDFFEKFLGKQTEPYFAIRNAKARAIESNIISTELKAQGMEVEKADWDGGQIKLSFKPASKEPLTQISNHKPAELPSLPNTVTIEQRAQNRILQQAAREQENLETIAAIAAGQIIFEYENDSESFSSQPVDDDWAHRFFDSAKFTSNEEMQKLWAKLLAGEVKKPGSFSLKTIEFLRNLSQKDANLIRRVASYVIGNLSWGYEIPYSASGSSKQNPFFSISGLTYQELMLLDELGIVLDHSSTTLRYSDPYTKKIGIFYQDKFFQLHNPGNPDPHYSNLAITQIGAEIFELCDKNYDLNFVRYFLNTFFQGFAVLSGEWKHGQDGTFRSQLEPFDISAA